MSCRKHILNKQTGVLPLVTANNSSDTLVIRILYHEGYGPCSDDLSTHVIRKAFVVYVWPIAR